MKKLVLAALAVCAAAFALGAATRAQPEQAEAAALQQRPVLMSVAGVPADRLPKSGRCVIWYDSLPADRQAPEMSCEHANWLAQRWGGRVITVEGYEAREIAAFEGRNDFTDVPPESLPRPGYCRAWLNDVAPDAQPEAGDCRTAQRLADARDGRVLFMPI